MYCENNSIDPLKNMNMVKIC